jgi:hypothetical protein
MKAFTLYLISLFIFFSCYVNSEEQATIAVKRKLIIDEEFSINDLLKEDDTLFMKISLAVCTSDRKDSLIFFKKYNKVYLRSFVLGEFKDTFDAVQYLPNDKIYSIEEILKRYKLTDSLRTSSWLVLILKNNDSLYASKGTKDLIDRLQFLNFYDSVMQQIYHPNNIEYKRNLTTLPTIQN